VRTCVIFNPAARGEKARKFRKALDEIGAQAELKATTCAGAARALAREALESGFKTVVAAGGDGTLNEVLNGIGEAENGFSKIRLAVLPLGTINVFAREVQIPTDITAAWEVIQRGKDTLIDVGLADYRNNGSPQQRYFLQLAGAGWDARAVELTNWEIKKKIGPGAYVLAGLQALSSAQPKVTVSNNKESLTGDVVIIGNGRLYGGTFPIFHQADYRDGVLDAVVFHDVNWQSLPKYAWQFVWGKMFKPGCTSYLQGSTLTLSSTERAALQLEGELVGELPATVSVLPKRLRIIVP
jgi:diacylglycerol kinase (ATP)